MHELHELRREPARGEGFRDRDLISCRLWSSPRTGTGRQDPCATKADDFVGYCARKASPMSRVWGRVRGAPALCASVALVLAGAPVGTTHAEAPSGEPVRVDVRQQTVELDGDPATFHAQVTIRADGRANGIIYILIQGIAGERSRGCFTLRRARLSLARPGRSTRSWCPAGGGRRRARARRHGRRDTHRRGPPSGLPHLGHRRGRPCWTSDD